MYIVIYECCSLMQWQHFIKSFITYMIQIPITCPASDECFLFLTVTVLLYGISAFSKTSLITDRFIFHRAMQITFCSTHNFVLYFILRVLNNFYRSVTQFWYPLRQLSKNQKSNASISVAFRQLQMVIPIKNVFKKIESCKWILLVRNFI